MVIGVDIRPLMDSEPSGVSHYLFNLLDNLFKIDQVNQYKLFYNSFRDVSARLPKWDYPNVKFYGFHWPNKFLSAKFLLFQQPKVDELIGDCDVFLISNLCYLALSDKCKKIITVHDLSFEFYPEFYKLKWQLSYALINPRKFLSTTNKLIAVSENTKRDLMRTYGLAEDKISVVYSGLQHESTRAREHESTIELPEKFILTLGTREPRKNLIGVLQAFEIIKQDPEQQDLKLIIAGGSGWLNHEVNRLISKSKFKSDIKVLGYVSSETKNLLYQSAVVFVYPSFYEGFGFPPLEAFANGCPVITSLSSATSEICGDAALLVDPYNVNDLVMGVQQIINQPTIKAELVAKGLKRVKDFSWEKAAKETLKIITKI